MRTPSHFMMTAIINYSIPHSQRQTIAFLFGSVLPDIPFTLLTIVYGLYYMISGSTPDNMNLMEYLHFDLFFRDPVWLIGHNIFHSLVVGFTVFIVAYIKRDTLWGKRLMWLALGVLLHTVVDIFTHHSDGPLFLFPLNWTYRFESPISYWEPEYFGNVFRIFEYMLNALFLTILLIGYFHKRNKNKALH